MHIVRETNPLNRKKKRSASPPHFEFANAISCNKRMATIRISRAYEAAFNVGPAFTFTLFLHYTGKLALAKGDKNWPTFSLMDSN
jgi:hypothetical protein